MGRPLGSKNKTKTAPPEPTTIPVATFSVLLQVNGEEHTGVGATLNEALDNLPRVNPKTKGTLTISKDGVASKPLVYAIPMFNRLFYPGLTGEIQRAQLAKRYTYAA